MKPSRIILNFHGVGPVRRSVDAGEYACWLEEDHFKAIVELASGFSHVQFTFDDGNASDLEAALPILQRNGVAATFFVCSGRLDQATFLSRDQVRELKARGMEIGSHGHAHVSWRRLPLLRMKEELEGSRLALEAVCDSPVDLAACPFGEYDRRVLEGLREAGYRVVYTSDDGVAGEADWIQARTTITRGMTVASVEQLIRRGAGVMEQWSINARKLWKRLR